LIQAGQWWLEHLDKSKSVPPVFAKSSSPVKAIVLERTSLITGNARYGNLLDGTTVSLCLCVRRTKYYDPITVVHLKAAGICSRYLCDRKSGMETLVACW